MGIWLENNWHYLFVFVVQSLFGARTLVQWILSEKAKKVVSPVIFWQLSLIASFLYLIYGWLRADFAIILGQLISYYIYIWNLNILNQWKTINRFLRTIAWFTPAAVVCMLVFSGKGEIARLWTDISFGLLIFGSIGHVIFSFRFIYQWWYSRRYSRSILPGGFWALSIVGSICILIYGIIRAEPMLIIGHGANFITYSRNLFLNRRNKQK
jgi:lipid-A-disaccharide synthase-like uncharacterized protein